MNFHTLQIGDKYFRIVQADVFSTNNEFMATIIIESCDTKIDEKSKAILHGDYVGVEIKLELTYIDIEEGTNGWTKLMTFKDENDVSLDRIKSDSHSKCAKKHEHNVFRDSLK